MTDDCDPASFNAVIGPGTCVGRGETTFQDFITQVARTKQADDWEFDGAESVRAGTPITVRNRGGETHSFTAVAQYGPGIVPPLNDLIFGPGWTTLPEFLARATANFVPAGQTISLPTGPGTLLPAGTYRFECAIHPWMRMRFTVRNTGGGGGGGDD